MDHPRRRSRKSFLEQLEQRMVMTIDLATQLLGEALHSDTDDEMALAHHALQDPQLAQPAIPAPDFWLDPAIDHDPLAALGDLEQFLASAHGLTGLTTARNDYGFTGAGQTVAIIDSGIAWDHPALGGGLGSNYRVVGGWDFSENDANPYDDGPSGSHGTHVAGIVGASDGTNSGVAPGVDLVGLRVFDDAGNGYFTQVEQALQWVLTNRNTFENPITTVNISLGTTGWNSTTVPSWSMLENEFQQLKAAGIFVAVSAGNAFNTFNTTGLSYPASSPHVVPVMSVDDSGNMSWYSQRHSSAIAAPGQQITSTVPDYFGNNNGTTNDWGTKSGTSMAAPYVAGASVLIREAMQFIGQSNITQQTIFNHMLATATQFYDAATNANYKRLNLGSAIDALIPNDEYGSSAGNAYNLGSIGASRQFSGLIGKVNDADYFRFTAASSGTITFTASTTHKLDPVWHASGFSGQVSGAKGETFSFQVTAGQSYTLGLSSSDGIGYYDVTANVAGNFTYVNWGSVAQKSVNNQSVAGEKWYRVQAGRTGQLSVEGFFAAAGGNVDISLYDANLQLVKTASSISGGKRLDHTVTAGQYYYIKCAGNNGDIDFRLTNLLAQNGSTVTLLGTADNDTFTFTAGSTHTLGINGVQYSFSGSSFKNFVIEGNGGIDMMTMTGTSGDESAVLRTVISELYGANYSVYASGLRDSTINGGGGNDSVKMYDSTKDDTFTAWHNRAELSGTGWRTEAKNFSRVLAVARGGNDRATFYDSSGDDTYSTWTNRAVLYGDGFSNDARDFERTIAYASSGNDRAFLRDGKGDDTYSTWVDRAVLYGDGFSNDARNFDTTVGYATGGFDKAYFRGSPGDDVYSMWRKVTLMVGPGYSHEARDFDYREMFPSSGNDQTLVFPSEELEAATLATGAQTSGSDSAPATKANDIAVSVSTAGTHPVDDVLAFSADHSDYRLPTMHQPSAKSPSPLFTKLSASTFERIERLEDLLFGLEHSEEPAEEVQSVGHAIVSSRQDSESPSPDALQHATDEALQEMFEWVPAGVLVSHFTRPSRVGELR